MRVCGIGVFAAVAGLWAATASAQLSNFVEVCGDPNADPRTAINFCQKALDSGKLGAKASAQVRANLGIALFEQGSYQAALDQYSQAIDIQPRMIALYLNRARAYEKLVRLNDAAKDYARALELEPESADAYLGRGAMLLSHGDPGRAVTDFDSAILLKPDWISPYFNRGVAYLRLGLFEEANSDFSTVISRNPDDAGAFLNRSRARALQGRADAGADFDRALEIEPEWGGGWFARGKYFDEHGNREAANRDFLRAYELGYPDPWLLQRIREISG